jgi:two-component system cell cycle response regulator
MRILIADDDRFSRMLLARLLREWGYEVEVVGDGEAAVAALTREGGPEIGIIDWMMPKLKGPEVCRAVRSSGDEPYRYLVLLTSLSSTDDLVHGLDSGADEYLCKPFKAPELQARLRSGRRLLDLQRQLIEARDALEIQATRDALTGVYNRRTLLTRLEKELSRGIREGTPVGVVMLDLDRFKSVNDTWGHLAGDTVLREACKRIQTIVRPYDLVGRFGGEEFIVVVPGADREDIWEVGERVREAVAAGPIAVDGADLDITTSVGVVSMRGAASPNVLIQAADEALYAAKRGGRDRVVPAWDMPAVEDKKAG